MRRTGERVAPGDRRRALAESDRVLSRRPVPRTPAKRSVTVRPARLSDVPALVELEYQCFDSDRLHRRQFRYMLTRARAILLLAEREDGLIGYVLVLLRRGTSMARVYSMAVDPAARRQGLGRHLLEQAERAARDQGVAYMRLEVRSDNPPALALYRREGYRVLGTVQEYYEDGMEALRLEKPLTPELEPDLRRVPYYEQTLDFTCGSSALMMAMKALDPKLQFSRTLELRLWREATTIFMASGHGGCGPFGLALAAAAHGFRVDVTVNDEGVPFIDSVRSPDKKEVMRLVHEDMLAQIRERRIRVQYGNVSLDDLRTRLEGGGIPIVLVTSYHLYREKVPHWVVITGFDDRFVYVNDPYLHGRDARSSTDAINTPIARRDFSRMARYGRAGLQAVVVISRPRQRKRASG